LRPSLVVPTGGRPSCAPEHTVSLAVFLTRDGRRTIKLYEGALQYWKPWDEPSQMYFEKTPLLVDDADDGKPVVSFESWFGLWDLETLDGPCTMCFSCDDYEHDEMTERGLLDMLHALFDRPV
jgi:hypothetical protein